LLNQQLEFGYFFVLNLGRNISALRHRRRINTQTIQRKNSTGTFKPVQKSKKSKLSKFFIFISFIIIAVAAVYFFMDKIIPILPLEKFNASGTIEPVADEPKQIPVEQDKTDQVQQFTPIQKRIQIEVLNGCGTKGIAKNLSDKLKTFNYDVVNSGNYLENGKEYFEVVNTKIIDQIKNTENIARAKELAEIMGIDKNYIDSFENPSPIADLTIVIGKDIDQLTIYNKE